MTTFVFSTVAALVLTPVTILVLRRLELVDVPNHRSSHDVPVPRGGGIALAVAALGAFALAARSTTPAVALIAGGVVLGGTGFADDRWQLGPRPRLLVQVLTPLILGAVVLGRVNGWLVVAVVVVAGYVNAFNFMDGINGISGTQAAIAGAFLALVADHVGDRTLVAAGWAICGASLGFLPYNAWRPRVFLGDVGSYFAGFWLAGLALLLVEAGAPALVVVGPFILYVFDTFSVLVRRARRGDALTEAHREHTYQRLTQAGWSHVAVTVLCACVASACAVIMYLVIDRPLIVQLVALAASMMLVTTYLLLPSMIGERRAIGALR